MLSDIPTKHKSVFSIIFLVVHLKPLKMGILRSLHSTGLALWFGISWVMFSLS